MDELHIDLKETCAEEDDRANGEAVYSQWKTLHEFHKEKQIKRNKLKNSSLAVTAHIITLVWIWLAYALLQTVSSK